MYQCTGFKLHVNCCLFQFAGSGLLAISVCLLTDPNNAAIAPGLIPVVCAIMLTGIALAFGLQTGLAINPALDLGGRLFAVCAGYGSEVFR